MQARRSHTHHQQIQKKVLKKEKLNEIEYKILDLTAPSPLLPPKGARGGVSVRHDDVEEIAIGTDLARALLELATGGLLEVRHGRIFGVHGPALVVPALSGG